MEKPNSKGANTFIVGLFVFVSFLVVAGFIVFMGGSSPFSRDADVRAFFRDIRGLNVGAPVFFSGIQVGRVKGYQFPTAAEAALPGQDTGVYVLISVFGENVERMRKDSEVTIATQGVLGDKVIVIKPGTDSSGVMAKGDTLPSAQPEELGDYFKRGGDLVENLNKLVIGMNGLMTDLRGSGKLASMVQNLDAISSSLRTSSKNIEDMSKDDMKVAVKSLRNILQKVDRGDGTLGALINDPSLGEDLRLLVGGAQRSKAVRFLIRQAISSGEGNSSSKSK